MYSGFIPISHSSQFIFQSLFQKRKANALTELLRDGGGLKKTLPVIWNVFWEHPAEPPTVPFPVLWQDEVIAPPAPCVSQLLDFSSLQEGGEFLCSSFPFSCLSFLHFFLPTSLKVLPQHSPLPHSHWKGHTRGYLHTIRKPRVPQGTCLWVWRLEESKEASKGLQMEMRFDLGGYRGKALFPVIH